MAYTPSCMHACMHMALLQALNILLLASMLVLGSAEEAAMLSATDGTNSPASSGTYPLKCIDHQYLVELDVGTSRKKIWAIADTGSDFVWTKRLDLCDRQTSPTFDHVNCGAAGVMCGSTCCDGHCMFTKLYGSGGIHFAKGFMGIETLALSRETTDEINVDDETDKVSFGCAIDSSDNLLPEGADGIVGLNRGPMSLLRQLHVNKFSYCLSNQSGRISFGDVAGDLGLSTGGKSSSSLQIMTTPLVQATGPLFSLDNKYFVELEGISIGSNLKYRSIEKEHFKHKSTRNDKGVMLVDTGTPRTYLESTVFEKLRELLANELNQKLPKENNHKTCFRAPPSKPKMVLYFTDEAQMHLPWENYMDEEEPPEAELFCLAIREERSLSILGNLQQQNTSMIYDDLNHEGKLSFVQNVNCM